LVLSYMSPPKHIFLIGTKRKAVVSSPGPSPGARLPHIESQPTTPRGRPLPSTDETGDVPCLSPPWRSCARSFNRFRIGYPRLAWGREARRFKHPPARREKGVSNQTGREAEGLPDPAWAHPPDAYSAGWENLRHTVRTHLPICLKFSSYNSNSSHSN